MALWDTTDFLTRVKRKAQWPTNPKLSDSQILAVADEELWTFIAPYVRGVSEAYWVKRYTTPIVAGQPLYRIPHRATSGSVFDVALLDSSNNIVGRLNKIQAADMYGYLNQSNAQGTGYPGAYFIEADQIRLLPGTSANLSLMVRYERRPSQLVLPSACAVIAHVGTNYVTSATAVAGCTFDLAQSRPNFDAIYDDLSMTCAGAGPYRYTATETLSGVRAGDYVCVPGQTCVVPVPDVLYPIAVDLVAAECLSEVKDASGSSAILDRMERKLAKVMETLQPRAETSAPSAFNRRSPMRS